MKIGANFIFKNEEHVLPRMLKSILPIVDSIYAVDTGSTDGSVRIVQDFIKENNLDGEVATDTSCTELIDRENCFIYDRARNKAMDLIKGKSDFGFWIDCDEQVRLPDGFDLNKFKEDLSRADQGMATCVYDNRYGRNCFFRNSKPFRWSHPIHELLECSEPIININVPIEILIKSDGATWTAEDTKRKYLKHALVLKREVERINHPRDVFYLAQSYKDAGEIDKAIEWYKKRALMNDGQKEEQFYAQHFVGILMKGRYDYRDVFFEYIKACDIDNARAENLLNAIIIMQEKGHWEIAYIMSKYCVDKYHQKNPYPNRILFIDQPTYDWKLLDVYKRSCRQLGKFDEISKYLNLEEMYDQLCKNHSDIYEHLPTLKRYAEDCNHITELGFKEGCSIYALLMGKPKQLVTYDINYHINIEQVKLLAEREQTKFEFINKDVLKFQIKKTDLLFIDTIGTYAQLSQELKLHSNNVTKYIIIHDTVVYGIVNEFNAEGKQGLQAAIEDFLSTNSVWGLSAVYTNNNGLTILERVNHEDDRITKFSDFE